MKKQKQKEIEDGIDTIVRLAQMLNELFDLSEEYEKEKLKPENESCKQAIGGSEHGS